MQRVGVLLITALLAVLLPFTGLVLSQSYVRPGASFTWPAFLIYASAILMVVAPFVWRILFIAAPTSPLTRRPFPWWGWFGLSLTAIAWLLAWTRFAWFAPLQLYTFTPLWLGYILVLNALAYRRTGHCLLLDRPRCFAVLFPASAAFWWYFEYINRYVGNWYYAGLESIGPSEYFIHATISFSTVLPAVLSTRDWLASFPRLSAGLTGVWPLRIAPSKALALLALLLGVGGFLGIGVWPGNLYSMVWLAPLLLLVSLQALIGGSPLLADLSRGNWASVVLPALAGLICGFFWELWNWHSLARWEYSIPLVHRFLIFEMPVLGYAGYLPFGILCVVLGKLVCGERHPPGK